MPGTLLAAVYRGEAVNGNDARVWPFGDDLSHSLMIRLVNICHSPAAFGELERLISGYPRVLAQAHDGAGMRGVAIDIQNQSRNRGMDQHGIQQMGELK